MTVTPPFWCDYGYNIEAGDYFYANHNLVIQDGGKVTFGDHVFIGPNCTFTTAEHALDPNMRREGVEIAKPITVGNNVWIGAGAVVLAGVTIGDNSVIGAGSVVKKDIPAGVIAVGVPCKVLRKITEADRPDPYFVVTLGLPCPLASARVAVRTEPYPGRWTHHIVIGSAAELDDELFGWLDQAYAFSESKR